MTDQQEGVEQPPLSTVLHVTIATRPEGTTYASHEDLSLQAKRWIEQGLLDRDDIADVAIRVGLPGKGLTEQLNNVLAAGRPRPGCRSCSEEHTSAPCECGHEYHGHAHMGGALSKCLNCSCREFTATDNYIRCGAWGGCPMPLGHNRGHSDIPENHEIPRLDSDNPAAQALARYITGHPASVVMAAFRELGWRLTFSLQPDEGCPHDPERHGPEAGCIECPCPSVTGHENGTEEPSSKGVCASCGGAAEYVEDPTGGRWDHWNIPADGHPAHPASSGCPAALLPLGDLPAEPCVVRPAHQVHRTAKGEAWTTGEEV